MLSKRIRSRFFTIMRINSWISVAKFE